MNDPYAKFEKLVMPNGLEVYCLEEPRPFARLEFLVRAGSRQDTEGKEGLAHFAEHLVSRNIPGFPDYSANKEFFNSVGGNVAFGSTGYRSTRYDFKLPIEDVGKGIDMFGAMLVDAKLIRQVEEQRSVILREYAQKYPTPHVADVALFAERSFFPTHRTAHSSAMGNPDSINRIDTASLQAFYDGWYAPRNISVVCAGGISMDTLAATLESSGFRSMKDGRTAPFEIETVTAQKPPVGKKTLKLSDFMKVEANQSMVKRAFALREDVDKTVQEGICQVLYDELFNEVREKRSLAYQIKVNYQCMQGLKMITVEASTGPSDADRVDSIIIDCIRKLLEKQKEFESKKRSAIRAIVMGDQSIGKIAESAMNDVEAFGRIKTKTEEIEEIASLAWDRVEATIQSMLDVDRSATLLMIP